MRSKLVLRLVAHVRPPRLAAVIIAVAVGAGTVLGSTPVAAGGAACHQPPPLLEGSNGVVEMKIMCFAPTVMRVQPGAVVRFVNQDQMVHLVTGVAYQWGSIDQVLPGSTTEVTFDKPGIYPYSCMLHYGMSGVIVVGDGVFASSPGVPAIKARSASSASGQPEPEPVAASISAPDRAASSRWLYAGMGALGGLVVAGIAVGVVSSRRPRSR
jgi:plastocyanin